MLMDEPFGALDAQTREVLQEELSRIQRARAQDRAVRDPLHPRGRLPRRPRRRHDVRARPHQAGVQIKLPDVRDRFAPEFTQYESEITRTVKEEVAKVHEMSRGAGSCALAGVLALWAAVSYGNAALGVHEPGAAADARARGDRRRRGGAATAAWPATSRRRRSAWHGLRRSPRGRAPWASAAALCVPAARDAGAGDRVRAADSPAGVPADVPRVVRPRGRPRRWRSSATRRSFRCSSPSRPPSCAWT